MNTPPSKTACKETKCEAQIDVDLEEVPPDKDASGEWATHNEERQP